MAHPFDSIFQRKLHTGGHPLLLESPEIVGQASTSSVIASLSVSEMELKILVFWFVLFVETEELIEVFEVFPEVFLVVFEERKPHAV